MKTKWSVLVVLVLLAALFAASGARADGPVPQGILSAGSFASCGLRPSGTADCWGNSTSPQSGDQPGPYTQISAGGNHNCALMASGAVDCWGTELWGNTQDMPGTFTQVSAGGAHNCALTPSGAVDCWGDNYSGQAVDQLGSYTQVDAGGAFNCALTPTGAVHCWGANSDGQAVDRPGPYTQVSAGTYHACALTPTGAAECWGMNAWGQATNHTGPYTQISAGGYHTCALTPTGAAECWGMNEWGQATNHTGPYTQISAGAWHACALTPSGAADCWGNNEYTQAVDQPGTYGPYIPSANVAPVAQAGGPYLGAINTTIQFDGSGSSDADGDALTYAWTFGDGGTATGVTLSHSYTAAGLYNVCLTVNDGTVDSAPACTMAVVYDPTGGFVTGGGRIDSPAGAYKPDLSLSGPATFGFVSRYHKGATVPTGTTAFQFDAAGFSFDSNTYEWLVVNQGGTNAQFKGSGTVNGGLDPNGAPFKFMIWAGDGSQDTLRIRIWSEAGGVETDVYDNGADQAIGAGNIVIHNGK